jgi:hypothetical protein
MICSQARIYPLIVPSIGADLSVLNVNTTLANKSSSPNAAASVDVAREVKGMYRVLDLIFEQGSGGLGAEFL